jgi:hypothetical protein
MRPLVCTGLLRLDYWTSALDKIPRVQNLYRYAPLSASGAQIRS